MLRNLPESLNRDNVMEALRAEGFAELVDFIYVPTSFAHKVNFGYVFVNFVSPEAAERCRISFKGFTRWPAPAKKPCDVSTGDLCQGLEAHIERYRNSPVMHEAFPDEFKPAIYAGGVRQPFPPPTKPVKYPRIRARKRRGIAQGDPAGHEATEDCEPESWVDDES